jgi:hypothetical protein
LSLKVQIIIIEEEEVAEWSEQDIEKLQHSKYIITDINSLREKPRTFYPL